MEFNKKSILSRAREAQQSTVAMDEGLRAYMLKVYNFMASGILLTGLVSLIFFKLSVVTDANGSIVALTSIGNTIFLSGFKWVVMLAPLAVVFYMSARMGKMSVASAQTTFWIFASLMGLSLSSIFLVYTGASITRVFFITSITFGAMSLYGYTYKKRFNKVWIFFNDGFNRHNYSFIS
tara:strand:- start:97 stop:633 length:537 start_codon:yes stop_codon:yes gene_type:complete